MQQGSTPAGNSNPAEEVPAANGTVPADDAGAVLRAAAGDISVPGEAHPPWHRVVLKLSGEAFAGGEPLGISPDAVVHIAKEVSAASREGIQVAAVVGGAAMNATSSVRVAATETVAVTTSIRATTMAIPSTTTRTPMPAATIA